MFGKIYGKYSDSYFTDTYQYMTKPGSKGANSKRIDMNQPSFDMEEKVDPIVAQQQAMERFQAEDYFVENQNADEVDPTYFPPHFDNQDYLFKIKCFYLFKYEELYGDLILKKDCITFEPVNPHEVIKGEDDWVQGNEKLITAKDHTHLQ